jgi:hypothetical protein
MIPFSIFFIFTVGVFYVCAKGGALAEAIYAVIGIMVLFLLIGMLASC